MNSIVAICYGVTGVLVTVALLTDKTTCQNKKEALYCVLFGLIWPLCIALVAASNIVQSVQAKRKLRLQERTYHILSFMTQLGKLRIVPYITVNQVAHKLTQKENER